MKATYHSNPGISDSSRVRNVSSKQETCFKMYFIYPHVSFCPINGFVDTFEVCERETWFLLASISYFQTAELWAWCFGLSRSLAPCTFWGQLISSVCCKPGRAETSRREATCRLLKWGSLLLRVQKVPIWIHTGIQDITIDFLLSLKVLNYFIA